MSDLSDAFKKAILAFTNASDFIVSLSDGGYMIVEDISDKMAVERKINQAQGEDYYAINSEIEAAVAFYNKLTPSFLIIQVALLEDYLLEICELAAQSRNVSFELDQPARITVEQAKSFFENKLGVQFPSPWPAWEKVQESQKLRDDIVNLNGFGAGSVGISDEFLVKVNESMVLFFEELQSYVLDALEKRT